MLGSGDDFGFFGSHLQKYICCKQIFCINVANSKCEKFHVHSPNDIQSCLAMPQTCHGIKVWNQCYSLSIFNKLFCSHTLCILEYMLKKNVQVRHRFMDLVTSVKFLDCFPLFFRSFLNQHFSVPFKQNFAMELLLHIFCSCCY